MPLLAVGVGEGERGDGEAGPARWEADGGGVVRRQLKAAMR
uniref:Uncharacterized protein n=1 Tax=Arundo donax TaxID=35708 RepID=A0A0A9BUG8_ARUDO